MTALSDTLTVCLVLILLFGSIALYLYTRIQQSEQKISLLEGILLDLKMSSEVKSYSELPAHEARVDGTDTYAPYEDVPYENEMEQVVHCFDKKSQNPEEPQSEVEQYKSVVADAINDDSVSNVSKYSNIPPFSIN